VITRPPKITRGVTNLKSTYIIIVSNSLLCFAPSLLFSSLLSRVKPWCDILLVVITAACKKAERVHEEDEEKRKLKFRPAGIWGQQKKMCSCDVSKLSHVVAT
jgi:hypothetical protein